MYFLDFAVGRRTGSVDAYDEILKEPAAPEKTRHGKVAGKPCHRFEEIGEYHDPDLMEIHRSLWAADNSTEFVLDTILQATYS